MSGMGSTLQLTNPTVVAAFHSALIHQGIIALLIYFLLAMLWVSVREWVPASRGSAGAAAAGALAAEPRGRRLIRIGFGLLWILDGLLQAQAAMPLGLATNVTEPAAASSPAWVQHLVDFAAKGWTYQPVNAAAAAVWIQVGIGIWLLTAARGRWSRLGGLASVGWGLVVWIFGEAFGGIFAPGLSWLFGAPGAALFYCLAGALIALPDRAWLGKRLGRRVLAVMGLFFTGMAVLQAWPGRGFWQGTVGKQPGDLTSMVQGMAQSSQPGFLAAWARGFGSFTAAHGAIVNLVAVIALAVTGLALLSGQRRVLRPALAGMLVLCAADWMLVQDMGIFGGLGTDPNSMIPVALIAVGGYLALAYAPAPAEAAVPAPAAEQAGAPADLAVLATPADLAVPAAATEQAAAAAGTAAAAGAPAGPVQPVQRVHGWRERLRPGRLAQVLGTASPRTLGAVGALGIAIIGVVPMAAASASTTASPIIAQALDGSSAPLDFRAPAFQLTNEHGRPVSLASLRGKVVLLTFLDPVCTSDCPIIAQEFRQADQLLGAQARNVDLVAVVANPVYNQVVYTQAFDRQEHMASLPNWQYLTGSTARLKKVWQQYGIAAQILPAGGMIGHSDIAYVIDRSGRTRTELNFDPGPGSASSEASFAGELSTAAQQSLASS
ncbi:MAG TPA: SCO family protein [Streptosporangiaceae bacterium]|nr:SCO family protein [Streptosporangiaceae bacterium]